MNKALLQIKDLHIGFRRKGQKKVIQDHLDLNIHGGEFICLIGPNGVGKSTLLKTLGKIIPPLSGDILLKGINYSHISSDEFSRNIGLVLTEHLEDSHLTAADVISMGRYPYTGFWGKLQKKDWQIVLESARKVGLEDLLTRPFIELSDGEKQKVMIAKALAQQTPLMLLDEPTAFLDFPTKTSLLIMLRKLARTHKIAIILSTHDIELAIKTADQIWLFPEHRKIISGIPEELVLEGQILEVFKNKEMAFDIETGHFERVFTTDKNIMVSGHSPKALWLKKALARNEISTKDSNEIEIKTDDQYHVYINGEKIISLSNIKDVLTHLNIQ